jgi:hypothetical protein
MSRLALVAEELADLEEAVRIADQRCSRAWDEYHAAILDRGELRARLELLKGYRVSPDDLSELGQEEGILVVMRERGDEIRPLEIREALAARGLDLSLRHVNTVVGRLHASDRVVRVARGKYIAR